MRLALILFLLLGALSTSALAQQATPGKVGIINIQEAIVSTKDGKKATLDLDQKFLPEQKEFETRQDEVEQLEDRYNKGGTTMTVDQRSQLARDIEEKKKRLERDMQDAEANLKAQQQQLLKSMAGRMMAVIAKYSREHGFSMILDAGNQDAPVLFAASGIDITQDVIALYDKGPA